MATKGSANTPHNMAVAPFSTISSDIAPAHGPGSSNVDAILTRKESLTAIAFKQTEESRGHPTSDSNLQYQVFNCRPYGHREYSERELETAFRLLEIASVPAVPTPINETGPKGKGEKDELDASNQIDGHSSAINDTAAECVRIDPGVGPGLPGSEAVGMEHLREGYEMHRQRVRYSPTPTERQVRIRRAAHNSRMRRLCRAHQQRAASNHWDQINARAQARMISASIQTVQQALAQENDEAMWG